MELLKERILRDGRCLPGGILKVDGFINHQMDPQLMFRMAEEFVSLFGKEKIDKVITIEASGIAPAIMTGYALGVPVLFAKKSIPATMQDFISTKVFSFTRNRSYDIVLNRNFIAPGERLLFIDDFLANGNAAEGIIDLVSQAGAEIAGMGFLIEKSFQDGGRKLRSKGIHVESLAIIDSLDDGKISFMA